MAGRSAATVLTTVRGITFDFGNTLVAVDRAGLERVVDLTARRVGTRSGPFEHSAFLAVWAEERERQFAEAIPAFREPDLTLRFVRVLARLRGARPPAVGQAWDNATAAALSDPQEIAWGLDVYNASFIEALPPDREVEPMLGRLAGRFRLGLLSNWPLAATIDRYVAAAGWAPHFTAVTVSQRVGWIKPHPAIFAAAAAALGLPAGPALLHVGDDWAADVVGARRAGWRAAWLAARPADSPLPGSERDGSVAADLVLGRLAELEERLPSRVGRRREGAAHRPGRDT